MSAPDIFLASASPRRWELLLQLGVQPRRLVVDVPEQPGPGESPAALVSRLALAKAHAGAALRDAQGLARLPVLGADTVVVVGGDILGKPADDAAGLAMLQRLQGREHQVLSGVGEEGGGEFSALSSSRVRWRAMTTAELSAYWATGEGRDKAGAYAVQGLAAQYIEHIEGSYSGIMGLPLFETAGLLRRAGVAIDGSL